MIEEDQRKSREGIRNVFIYPEKQTPVEMLSARITRVVSPYIDETLDEEVFDEMALEIRAVGKRFIKEAREEMKRKAENERDS